MSHRGLGIGLRALAAMMLLGSLPAAEAAEVRHLAPATDVLIGTSGNVLIVSGPEGALIVDDERPADVAEILAAVKAITPDPIRYAVNTHWHLDHSGGNEALAKIGAVIVAQRNVRVRRGSDQFMPAYNRHIPAAPPEALPAVVFDDRLELHLGTETIDLRHAANAHTDGDAIVRLEHANVIHMGDIFFNGIWPFIDRGSGGDSRGLIRAVDMALAMADARTVIVPGHGPIATREDLRRYRDMLVNVSGRVQAQITAGKALADVVASKPAAAYRQGMEGDEDRFVGAIYDSLKPAG
jgi:cyclase